MWKMTLINNVMVLTLLWLISQIAITPACNLLVQYAQSGVTMPPLAELVLRFRIPSVLVPVAWAILTLILGLGLRDREDSRRLEFLSLHASLSAILGLLVLFFFLLGGILPALKINGIIS